MRVLFALDSSDSMVFNDPNDLHVDVIEGVVQRFRDQPNVSFGILRWGERVVRELVDYAVDDPALFTKDEVLLGEAFDRMRQRPAVNADKYLGGTNYELALDEVNDYVMEDMADNPATISVARYYVVFMTDGMRQSGTSTAQETRDNVVMKVEGMRGGPRRAVS